MRQICAACVACEATVKTICWGESYAAVIYSCYLRVTCEIEEDVEVSPCIRINIYSFYCPIYKQRRCNICSYVDGKPDIYVACHLSGMAYMAAALAALISGLLQDMHALLSFASSKY